MIYKDLLKYKDFQVLLNIFYIIHVNFLKHIINFFISCKKTHLYLYDLNDLSNILNVLKFDLYKKIIVIKINYYILIYLIIIISQDKSI